MRAAAGLCVMSSVLGCTDLLGRTTVESDAGVTDAVDAADVASFADVTDVTDVAPQSAAPACMNGNVPLPVEPWNTSLDLFADTPLLRMNVRATSADAAGRVYMAGFFDRAGVGTFRAAVWRFEREAPTLDRTWGVEGRSLEPEVAPASLVWLGLQLDAEQRVVVAGIAEAGTSVTTIFERLDTSGAIDPTFGVRGRLVVTSSAWPIGTRGFYPYGLALGERGGLAVGGDETTTQRPLPRALALAFDADGSLSADFGQRGMWVDNTLHGCFDARRDGDGWVLACVALDDRPALIRLDARGQRDPAWGERPGAPTPLHSSFHVRSLERDGLGRWLVGGVISAGYDKSVGPAAVVRYHPDGTLDRSFAAQGTALIHEGRNSFVYSGRGLLATGCEDRVLIGLSNIVRPLMQVFDASGRWRSDVSPSGYLPGPAHMILTTGTYSSFVTAVTPHEVLLVTPSRQRLTLARYSM